MADCLNEQQVTSNLDGTNQDSLNSNLDAGNSITSDIGTDGVLTSNMTSGESVSSVLNSDEALASKLDFPSSGGEKYDDTELRGLIEDLQNDKVDRTELKNYYTQDEVDDLIGEVKDNEGETSSSFMPVGSIFSSAIPQIDARVHLLDGSTISQTGVYADFATLLKTLVASGYNLTFSSNAEYENQIETYGQCGRFVIDDNAGTIRLPTITKFVEGLTDLTNIGKSFYAGLPNITGTKKGVIISKQASEKNGAFAGSSKIGDYWDSNSGGSYVGDRWELDFNASSSNPIYGKSHTVQPQSTAYPYYIVLAGGYKSNEQVNIDQIATDVNLKADKTLSNVSYPQNIPGSTTMGSGDRVVETYISSNGNTWYRKWASGWKECGGIATDVGGSNSGSKIVLPINFANTNYTCITTIYTLENTKDTSANSAVLLNITNNSFNVVLNWTSSNGAGYFAGKFRYYCCGY